MTKRREGERLPGRRPGDGAVGMVVNGGPRELVVEARVGLLDALGERLDLPGTKKGWDGARPRPTPRTQRR